MRGAGGHLPPDSERGRHGCGRQRDDPLALHAGAAFAKPLREARRDAVGHAVIRLQRASSEAVTVLYNPMTKEEAPAPARITAARALPDYTTRADIFDEPGAGFDRPEERVKQQEVR